MIPIHIDLSRQDKPVIAGRCGEHNFRELVLSLPDELKAQGIDHYILAFADESGNAFSSERLTLDDNETLHYPLPSLITRNPSVKADITAFDTDSARIEKYGKSPTISLVFLDSVDSDNAPEIDGTAKGIVAQAVEISSKFSEDDEGNPLFNGKPLSGGGSGGISSVNAYTDLPTSPEDGAIAYVREDSLVGGIAVPPDLSYTEGVHDKQYPYLYIKESPPRPIYPFGADISDTGVYGDASSHNGAWIDFYLSIVALETSEGYVIPVLTCNQYLYSWESESVVVDIVGSGNTEEMITLSPGWNELDDIDYPTEATPVNFADIQSFFEDANIYVGDLYQIPEQAVADLENCLYVYNPTPTEYRRGWYSYSVSEGWERIPDGDYITVIENYESDTIRLSPKHNHNYYFGEISEIFVPHMPEGHYCTSIQFTTHPEDEFYFETDEPMLWDGGEEPTWDMGKKVIVTIRDGITTAVMGG